MVDVQEIFNRVVENKRKVKDIKTMLGDGFKNSKEYQEIKNQLQKLNDNRRKLEAGIRDQYKSELEKIDVLEMDIKADTELMGDAAMTMMMKGEHIEVQDEYKNVYDPEFKVKFKKKR